MIKKIVCVAMVALSCLSIQAQSKTISDFETENEGWNLHLYQSVIRMLNKDNNDDFNELIKDLEYIQVLVTDSSSVISLDKYKQLTKSIQSEGFEVMLDINDKEAKAGIYQKELSNGEVVWTAFAFSVEMGRAFAFEMKGSLNMKYLSAFESLDFQKIKDIAESQN